ncbi:MAG TPA: MMPL family transporter [Thermoleophilaceae bacterium]|nr:MMPL family transporter [Thermoleophilaceae bacterium]
MLARLADLAHDHPRRVLVIALLLAIAAGAGGSGVADRLDPYGADDPDSETFRATALIEEATGSQSDAGVIALVRSGGRVTSRAGREKVEAVAREIRDEPAIGSVSTYFDTRERSMLSLDRRATFVVAQFRPVGDRARQDVAERLVERLERRPGVTVGGTATAEAEVNATVENDLKRAELLAFPLLFLLSLLFFRSLVAALLPLLIGGLAIVGTFFALRVAAEGVSISVVALNLTTGLGLGLAIDYSLFIVSRYREEIARTGPGREAIQATLATAGRTVLFSSLTVAAALAALLTFPQRFLYSMGLGGMLVAIIAAAVALLVLPAVLVLLGDRVNALAPRRLQRAAERDARPASDGAWYRLSRFVMRRPGRVAIASGALLIALGIPFLRADFFRVDASVLGRDTGPRQVHEALLTEFPPHATTPLQIVAKARPGPEVQAFAERVGRFDGAAAVRPPRPLGEDLTLIEVVPEERPLSEGSLALLDRIRGADPGFEALVTGFSADFEDQQASLADHIPLAALIVFGTTFVVLFLMTGSLILPVKAAVMNLLTISAAFGVLVLIFQDGRLEGLLAYESQGALESTLPLLLFAVAFGLSTDYAVFLLSRIKEARDSGVPDGEAVAVGLERTGRIVTAAAILFSVAIGAFATSEIVFLKQNGIGTAVAVLIDASIVRALLVPALMELLGRWNWWAPGPLRRLHRRFGLSEGTAPSRA